MPQPDDCTFYSQCLEPRYNCGSTGYPLGYGYYYCNKFEAVKPQLSTAGQAWVTDTMLCLQNALVPEALGQSSAVQGCQNLWDYAFSTHAGCYLQSGICLLPPNDWFIIVQTIGVENLVTNFQALIQAVETAVACLAFYEWLLGYIII